MTPPSRNYEIGHGKPPLHTRFKKGQSGNPRGRPRQSISVDGMIDKLLRQPVAATVRGKRKRITMLEALLRQAINSAVKPDWRLMKLVLDYLPRAETKSLSFPIGPDGKPQIPIEVVRDILFDEKIEDES